MLKAETGTSAELLSNINAPPPLDKVFEE